MKIVQINTTYKSGSTGRLAYELSEELILSGNKCKIAFSVGKSNNDIDYEIGSQLDRKIHAMLSRITGKQGYFSYFATKKLIVNMKQFKPDIVHLHNLHSNYINLNLLFNYLISNKIATVITLHDCWFYTGKCTYYIPANCEKWKTQCNNCPLLHVDNVNKTYFFDRTKKCFNDKLNWLNKIDKLGIVGVSNWISDEARHSYVNAKDVYTIYNWVDNTIFFPRNTKAIREKLKIRNKFIVLMVSNNISLKKGYKEMILLSKKLDNFFQIVIVGENKNNLKIPTNVIHIPHTDDVIELVELYSLADVCINTTKYETFGMVTAESMSCGTPVIVYDNTASPELVGRDCGYIIKESDGIEALLNAVYLIAKLGKKHFSQHCINNSNLKFNKNTNIEKYFELYKKLI